MYNSNNQYIITYAICLMTFGTNFFQSASGPTSLIPTICGSNAGQHGEF